MINLESTSTRAQILQAIGENCQNLLALLPTGTEAEASIYWARRQLKPTELPALVITPGIETAERDYGNDILAMPVTISVAVLLGAHNALDLGEMLLAELRTVVPGADPTFNGLATDTVYTEGGVEDYPENQEQALVVNATFTITYETSANQP